VTALRRQGIGGHAGRAVRLKESNSNRPRTPRTAQRSVPTFSSPNHSRRWSKARPYSPFHSTNSRRTLHQSPLGFRL